MSNSLGQAGIEDGLIVVRIKIDSLQTITDVACDFANYERCRISDVNRFAEDVVRELNCEDEVGTTPLHRCFDAAIMDAIENGSEWIEE